MNTGSNIAVAINAAHDAVERSKREAIGHARECGRLLTEAKATVEHGKWAAWVGEQCAFSMRTAQLYMKAAAYVGDDPAKAQRVADLNLRDLAAFIAERPAADKLLDLGVENADEFSEEDQKALLAMLGWWRKAKPGWRKQWRLELARLAKEQGVPESQVIFPENGGGAGVRLRK
ncbi:DUF3102 domain-containing protein [Mesorhizobium australicum]|uniref:DUF3102 domain-containing protein n=1 Tax=Mesorhizobium australicum TaxID=536018 RepID=UPI00333B2933